MSGSFKTGDWCRVTEDLFFVNDAPVLKGQLVQLWDKRNTSGGVRWLVFRGGRPCGPIAEFFLEHGRDHE